MAARRPIAESVLATNMVTITVEVNHRLRLTSIITGIDGRTTQ